MATTDRAAEALLERNAEMEHETRLYLPQFQEVADFMFPRRATINVKRSPGQLKTDRMVDSTAMHAKDLLSASMQGALTSSAFMWFGLRIRNVEVNRDSQLQKDLEWCARDMYDAMEESNFQSESHELYQDLPTFGTAAIIVEERSPSLRVPPGSLRFTALAPGSFNIDEDEEGRVDTLFRKYKLSARAAATAFGEKAVGPQIQAALKRRRGSERFEFLHAIYPRSDLRLRMSRAMPATNKPWASITVDIAGRVVVRSSGYDTLPFMVPRWAKSADEVFGSGPGLVALPDVKTLNKAVELKLKAWAKVVDPPMKVRHQGVIGAVKLQNGGITYVRDMDAIVPLTELGGRLDIADMEEEKKREQIRRIFYSDQLQLQQGPQMTAYEVQVRYELMQRILGPTMGRARVEYLEPMLERVFWIRLSASDRNSPYRRIEAWAKANGKILDIEYESPLAKAQRIQESIAIQRAFQLILPLSQSKPDVLDNMDFDYASRSIVESSGAPTGLLRDPEARDAIRTARTQAAEQKNQLDSLAVAAKAGGDVSSLIQAMNSQNAGQPGSIIPQSAPVLASGVAPTGGSVSG